MNQMSKRVIELNTNEEKQKLFDQDGGCEHVEQDISKAYILYRESDSFGTVGTSVCCRECADAEEQREAEEICTCKDCKQSVKRSEGREWRWYDFYAAQGDTPYFICNGCWSKPNHQNRMDRDRDDYNQEHGISPQDEGEDERSDEEEAEWQAMMDAEDAEWDAEQASLENARIEESSLSTNNQTST